MSDSSKPIPIPGEKIWHLSEVYSDRGPFSSEDIQGFVLEGKIKLEELILNSATNQWSKASDAFFGLEEVLTPVKKDWNPPPRPQEITSAHSSEPEYGSNTKSRMAADYLSLVSHSAHKATLEISKLKSTNRTSPKKYVFKGAYIKATQVFRNKWTAGVAASLLVSWGGYSIVSRMTEDAKRGPASFSQPPLMKAAPRTSKAIHSHPMPSADPQNIGNGIHPVSRQIAQPQAIAVAPPATETPTATATPTPSTDEVRHLDPKAFEATNSPVTPPNMAPAGDPTAPPNAATADTATPPPSSPTDIANTPTGDSNNALAVPDPQASPLAINPASMISSGAPPGLQKAEGEPTAPAQTLPLEAPLDPNAAARNPAQDPAANLNAPSAPTPPPSY